MTARQQIMANSLLRHLSDALISFLKLESAGGLLLIAVGLEVKREILAVFGYPGVLFRGTLRPRARSAFWRCDCVTVLLGWEF